uniref:Variant surface glycoprotein 1729 n=1 Tax=Trypanosoma brucei TaxID=5691 RepID=M4T0U9_9TRYP|nr:variant surface glycoprotein 1729 [Trypanosoma brucei]
MYSTLTIALLTLALLRQVYQAPKDHKNAADLQVLCDLMNLAKGSIAAPTLEQIPESALDDLERINISLADLKWRSTLAATAKDKKKDSQDCKSGADKEVCKAHYSRWEDHNIAVLEDTKGQKFPKISNDKLETTLGRSIAIAVSGLTAKAQAIRQDFNTVIGAPETPSHDKIRNLLAKAAYGASSSADAADKGCKVTLDNSRATACKLPAGASAVCETLICLCGRDSAQDKELCGAVASPSNANAAWASPQRDAKWAPVRSVCDAQAAQKLTPTYIRQTLAAALKRIKHCGDAGSNEALVLGTAHTDCSCQS